MSWLLFMDESGHDHRQMPYEVRGGIAIHASKIWDFVQDLKRREISSFGAALSEYKSEIKGSKLLDKKRFQWAKQDKLMGDEQRRKNTKIFLTNGLEHKPSRKDHFTAYGQSCLIMARGVLESLRMHEAVLFATAIPRGIQKPSTYEAEEFLRKDQVFLFERFFYFLESKNEYGLLVFDEVDKHLDRQFVRKMEAYFSKTGTGQFRTKWIVPAPLFVSSDMAHPVQAADLCIYCINWGFRLPTMGMEAEVREEIKQEFGYWLSQLQFKGNMEKEGKNHQVFGITFVPDPYTSREQ